MKHQNYHKILQEFKAQVLADEGIELDNIEYNPGKRQQAKLSMNSACGDVFV